MQKVGESYQRVSKYSALLCCHMEMSGVCEMEGG